MFFIKSEPLPGVFVIEYKSLNDNRGQFNKIFESKFFDNLGLKFQPEEYFFSTSKKNVLRGMHFQIEEAAHDKLVFCTYGNVLDVVVDVRRNSSFFNKPISIDLSADKPTMLFIGKGFAHGFLTKSDYSTMHYLTSTVHNQVLDRGVLWSSIDFKWPVKKPVLSKRDMEHPSISDLKCEFS